MWKNWRRVQDTTRASPTQAISATERERLEQFAAHFNARQPFTEPDSADLTLWESGALVPWFITHLLNEGRHVGPEVDIACHAEEPAVDLWEAGALYPSWGQTVALARLVDVRVRDLAHPDARPRHHDNRMLRKRSRVAILSFEPDAVRETIDAHGGPSDPL